MSNVAEEERIIHTSAGTARQCGVLEDGAGAGPFVFAARNGYRYGYGLQHRGGRIEHRGWRSEHTAAARYGWKVWRSRTSLPSRYRLLLERVAK